MNKTIKYYLLREKPARMLTLLLSPFFERKTASGLSLETDTMFSHTLNIVGKYEKAGLVAKERNGRQDDLTLTKKGFIIAKHLESIFKMLEVA